MLLALAAHLAFAQETEGYVVQPGDTLYSIAATRGTTVDAVASLNEITDPSVIAVGQTLLVPAGTRAPVAPSPAATNSSPPTASAFAFIYVAQPGDTASGIARRFSLSIEDLMVANHLVTPDRVAPGDQLRIEPGAAQRATAVPSSTPTRVVSGTLTTTPTPTRTATASPSQATTTGSTSASPIVSVAMQQNGAPYAFGGTTPGGFDCSGFVYYVFRQVGLTISRDIFDQYAAGSHPAPSDLQPGDLVFFQNTYMDGLSHVGIFVGNGQFIHAVDERTGVTVSNLNSTYWTNNWYGATRLRPQ